MHAQPSRLVRVGRQETVVRNQNKVKDLSFLLIKKEDFKKFTSLGHKTHSCSKIDLLDLVVLHYSNLSHRRDIKVTPHLQFGDKHGHGGIMVQEDANSLHKNLPDREC